MSASASTTTPPQRKRALHFGLAGHPTDPSVSDAQVQALVTSGAERARAAGWEVRLTFWDGADFDAALGRLRAELETGGWDALVVGGGLKMAPRFRAQFEALVNLWGEVVARRRKEGGKGLRIVFQGAPGDVAEVLEGAQAE